MADEMLALVETLDHPITRAHAINYVTGLAVFLGDYSRANAMAREEIELARAAKLPHYEAYGMIFLGRTLLQDNWQAAIENVLSGLALRKSTGALLLCIKVYWRKCSSLWVRRTLRASPYQLGSR